MEAIRYPAGWSEPDEDHHPDCAEEQDSEMACNCAVLEAADEAMGAEARHDARGDR